MYLNCHTYYSLRYGTFSELDLLELAQQHGITQLALTDINTTSACLNFIRKAAAYNIRPIVGIDFRNGADQQFVGLAKNNQGFEELNVFLSEHLQAKKPFPEVAPFFEHAYVIYPFQKIREQERNTFAAHEYMGIAVADLGKFRFSKLNTLSDRLVIQQPVTFRHKTDFNTHRLLRAIANNVLLSRLQKTEQGQESDRLLPLEELLAAFADFPQIIQNTNQLMDHCTIHFDFGNSRSSQNQQVYANSKAEDYQILKKLCDQGFPRRYKNPTAKIRERLKTELQTIQRMDFVSYFLINYDLVSYAKSQGYFHVGRGSGANSIVAYIIGITDVDPIELDLYFERFINPFRASPPDFDIDFSWKDREDVTAYIFKRFKNVALLATYTTFKYRAVVRELGKVFGLPKAQIDVLSAKHFDPNALDEISLLVLKYGKLLQGMPNYLGIHAAGILILDKPIAYYSAIDVPPKGFPTVQFDMIIAEDVGIFKFDILGQRGLAKIKEALEIIRYNRPELPPIDITQVEKFKTDPKINTLLKTGRATGAYYVESPAMRGLMQKLQTQDYLGLVAASSIIRPGVSSSGMKNEYIRRHRHPERRPQAHPILQALMPETYGIMVYQEDVLKVAHYFAGLSLAEADILRRGMSGKFRSREEFVAVEQKYIANCRAKGYPDTMIFEIWDQIKSFAGFAFAKGHSASYAVESYQSLFLKCYFPLEFMTAVLNNGGGFYSSELYIHEIKMSGGTVVAPCINTSDHPNRIQGTTVYLGLGLLQGLHTLTIQRILSERQLHGPFSSLANFIDRMAISIAQITILIRVDAFRCMGIDKRTVLWQALFKLNALKTTLRQPVLFVQEHRHFEIPKLINDPIEEAYDQLELLGFPLCGYWKLLQESPNSTLLSKDLQNYIGKKILIYGVLVNTRFHTASNGKQLRFSTFTGLDGAFFDAVHFSKTVDKYPISGIGVYACYGKVTEEFDFCSLEVIWTQKQALLPDPRSL